MRLLSITLARITTVRFCVNCTGEAMRTSPYLPFAKSIVPLALSILLVTASTPRGRYWYNVDTPDLEPLHSILISRHPVWGWSSRWPASRGEAHTQPQRCKAKSRPRHAAEHPTISGGPSDPCRGITDRGRAGVDTSAQGCGQDPARRRPSVA